MKINKLLTILTNKLIGEVEVMKTIIIILILVVFLLVIERMLPLSKKGKDKWEAHRRAGKNMLDDFDEERKNIDKLMR